MRLEWPFVFGLDDAGCALECLIDIAGLLGDFALAHRRLADVIMERRLLRKRRRRVRPGHLEFARRLDRVPLLVGDHAEEALIPDYLGAGNVLDRALVHSGRYRASDRGTN